VVQFLEWRSGDWLAKANLRTGTVTSAVCAGLSAYANKQGSVFHDLAVRFSQRWRSALISLSLPHTWATEFLELHKKPLDNPDFKKRKQTKTAPVTHTRAAPPPPTATADIPPATPETIGHEAKASDADSDGTSSDYSESEYESTSSGAE